MQDNYHDLLCQLAMYTFFSFNTRACKHLLGQVQHLDKRPHRDAHTIFPFFKQFTERVFFHSPCRALESWGSVWRSSSWSDWFPGISAQRLPSLLEQEWTLVERYEVMGRRTGSTGLVRGRTREPRTALAHHHTCPRGHRFGRSYVATALRGCLDRLAHRIHLNPPPPRVFIRLTQEEGGRKLKHSLGNWHFIYRYIYI